MSATSSSFYGYFGGGSDPIGVISKISRLDFSSETFSDIVNLPSVRTLLAAISNSN